MIRFGNSVVHRNISSRLWPGCANDRLRSHVSSDDVDNVDIQRYLLIMIGARKILRICRIPTVG